MKQFAKRVILGVVLTAYIPAAFALLPPGQTGNFYVGDFVNARVVVYDASGALLDSFTAPGLSGPRGILVRQDGVIYVASQFTSEVFVFDSQRQFKTKFTNAELVGPTGMAMSDFGELYVSSFNNDRVVVFTVDGTYVRSFTGGGLDGPNCVAFDSSGDIYVSSALTNNVIKFDAHENLIMTFTGGGLGSPMGIARDSTDVFYVAGGSSNNIAKFDTDGNFLGELAHPDLTGPQGTAFDQNGHLFASSFYQNNIVEFDANGTHVRTITEGNLSIPRSIAFVPIPGPNDPHLIYTVEQLNAIGAEPNDWNKHFKLMVDPNLAGYVYDAAVVAPDVDPNDPAFQGTPFTGRFDGNGHTVWNLTIDGAAYLGLFGRLDSTAEVANLELSNVSIGGTDYVGGLVGFNYGRITASRVVGAVSGSNRIGGITGRNWGSISASSTSGTVSGVHDVGGLVAANYGEILTSYCHAAVSGNRNVGGLVGKNYGSIATTYSTGTVTANTNAGGLVAYNWPDAGTVIGFWDVETSGLATSDGGVGRTTVEMQTANTFLDAGWDIANEAADGTEDFWKIAEGLDYPRLWWEELDGRVSLDLSQMFTVRLQSNPTTGYQWEQVKDKESILEQIGEVEFRQSETGGPPLPGAGGWEIFQFNAVSTGQMILKLVYRRPWEEGVEPLQTFLLQVTVP
jgi:predicted secreted protein